MFFMYQENNEEIHWNSRNGPSQNPAFRNNLKAEKTKQERPSKKMPHIYSGDKMVYTNFQSFMKGFRYHHASGLSTTGL